MIQSQSDEEVVVYFLVWFLVFFCLRRLEREKVNPWISSAFIFLNKSAMDEGSESKTLGTVGTRWRMSYYSTRPTFAVVVVLLLVLMEEKAGCLWGQATRLYICEEYVCIKYRKSFYLWQLLLHQQNQTDRTWPNDHERGEREKFWIVLSLERELHHLLFSNFLFGLN